MRVVIQPDAVHVARRAAEIIAQLICRKPRCVLGLATGSTPLGTYAELIRMHREDGLDFSQAVTFNLDEYVGLGPDHPQSYRYFMRQSLFRHINIHPGNTHVPDGLAADFETHCEEYERQIRDVGGVDLQILGIGTDGHMAFNEPGSSLGSRTRLKTLARETIRDNARYFGSEDRGTASGRDRWGRYNPGIAEVPVAGNRRVQSACDPPDGGRSRDRPSYRVRPAVAPRGRGAGG